MAPMFENSLSSACTSVKSLKTVPDWNNFYETTDHLQQCSDLIILAFCSTAKPLHSPRLVSLNSFNFDQKRCNASKGFRASFCISSNYISFFWFSLKLRSFLSLLFLRLSIMCRRVFNKTIILLGLSGYEMMKTNEALRASMVIYHFISSAPSLKNLLTINCFR